MELVSEGIRKVPDEVVSDFNSMELVVDDDEGFNFEGIHHDLVVFHILLKLPVKTLLRFRAVCKACNALISNNSQFIKLQQSHSKKQQQPLLVRSPSMLYSLTHNFQQVSPDWWTNFEHHIAYYRLNPKAYRRLQVLCSCDGLILIRVVPPTKPVFLSRVLVDHYFVLWNPSIRKYKLFSYKYAYQQQFGLSCFGVCYDPYVDSYKVVIHALKVKGGCDTAVYNVSTDTWSTVKESYKYYYIIVNEVVLANGLLHWVCGVGHSDDPKLRRVVYFDLLEERLKEVQQPDYGEHGHGQYLRVGLAILKDELCIHSFAESKQEIKVWIRKAGLWTSLMVIPTTGRNIERCKFLSMTEEGQVLMCLQETHLFMYSDSERSFSTPVSHLLGESWSVITHVDTLALMNVL